MCLNVWIFFFFCVSKIDVLPAHSSKLASLGSRTKAELRWISNTVSTPGCTSEVTRWCRSPASPAVASCFPNLHSCYRQAPYSRPAPTSKFGNMERYQHSGNSITEAHIRPNDFLISHMSLVLFYSMDIRKWHADFSVGIDMCLTRGFVLTSYSHLGRNLKYMY